MDVKQLRYFVHVAEMGSFSKAAAYLSIAQPALSRQIRNLEMVSGSEWRPVASRPARVRMHTSGRQRGHGHAIGRIPARHADADGSAACYAEARASAARGAARRPSL